MKIKEVECVFSGVPALISGRNGILVCTQGECPRLGEFRTELIKKSGVEPAGVKVVIGIGDSEKITKIEWCSLVNAKEKGINLTEQRVKLDPLDFERPIQDCWSK